VKELKSERETFFPPERLFGFESDIAPLIIVDGEKGIGNFSLGAFVRFLRELLCLLHRVLKRECAFCRKGLSLRKAISKAKEKEEGEE
jgi:hypothetical protein